ncbi:unnamed protein product [Schistosoma rodhaini]|uniref:Complex I-15 kDa n=1 Tax=Schistosoma rodhaini TaxID=6188 RepID=A0AA85EL62_9TREM|nr:unnamed protein product [Schistosoma rodhaini]
MAEGAFVITDQERLDRLNNEARAKKNRDIPFSPNMFQPFYNFTRKIFATEKPYEGGRGFPLTYTSGGNFLHRPFIDVPALQMTTSWFTMQNVFNSRFCQIMERDFFRCVARVGIQNTDKHCKIYWEDLLECQNHDKAKKRAMMMEKVRKVKKMEPMATLPYSAFKDSNF